MDLAELTVTRRTVHNYKTALIEDSLVEKALELSLWAPNHKQTYPWTYFWIGPAVRQQLAELAVDLKAAKEPAFSETKKKAVRESVSNPSHLILLALKRGAPDRAHEDYATLACSVQIASMYLWQKGIASKWSTGGFAKHARAYEILGISPAEFVLEGALLIGFPQVVPAAPERPPLSQFLRRTT